jgi:hypothetical protein
MKRLLTILTTAVALALVAAAPAAADFGLKNLEFSPEESDGSPATQAGSHPFALTATFEANTEASPESGFEIPQGALKDLNVLSPAGLVGNPTAVPRCATADFQSQYGIPGGTCPDSTVVGKVVSQIEEPGKEGAFIAPVYNLPPPPGVAATIGFWTVIVPYTFDLTVNPDPPYNVIARPRSIPQVVPFYASKLTLWGVPASPVHDRERGVNCIVGQFACPVNIPERPFLTLPTRCGPLAATFQAHSWEGGSFEETIQSPEAVNGCSSLGFSPGASGGPTARTAQSPSGLDFNLAFKDEGLTSPTGVAQSDIQKAVVKLPPGLSINPAIAEGLATCSEADYERESAFSEAGEGCPQASKVGEVEVETPLLEGELLKGSVYVATQDENKAHSRFAIYMVIQNPKLGISVKLPGRIEPDEKTGQLTTTFEEVPQFPFSEFRFHFREGARSPLATPAACGEYRTEAELTPWSGGPSQSLSVPFQIVGGPESRPCPSGGTPPLHPGLVAGTVNNAAGRYSPFNLRLSRNDSEQELTHFSIKLPPGLIGKLAGIPYCSDAAIAAAKARTGPHGGAEELASPSCPAASEVGRTLVGAGVGPSLAYAPGKVYLAGPYHGSALSIAAITAAKVGPFDLGTVVVREALKINPETAEVFIDATGSDPIPHIIKGIPVHARDIRVFVDRPNFVLNPTSCAKTSTASTVLGSGTDFGSEADDQPVTVTSPFQAADCASLGFAPKLALSLKGGTKRNDNPAFKAVLTYPKGSYANIASAQVTLPHSEFLDNEHIKTICTRVQFAEGRHPGEKCPAGSVYGYAKAITPILSDPIQGPVYLRSSSHNLPDLVAALHNGQIDINLVGRIDSVKGGRIRNTFESVPDAPVTKFTLTMQGGKKGLLVNSANLCARPNKAIAAFTGQNGKTHEFNPVLKPQCAPKARGGRKDAPQEEAKG